MGTLSIIILVVFGIAILLIITFLFALCYTHPEEQDDI